MIKTVTITGADDSIKPEELFEISKKYPFVEWAILVSRSSNGQRRFPSFKWIERLAELNNESIIANNGSLKFSCHLCGAYVRELLTGNIDFIEEELDSFFNIFSRVQINTHAEKHIISNDFAEQLAQYPGLEFIFQYDGVNHEMIDVATNERLNMSVLFDLSHGTGVLPEEWPELIEGLKCGYAGGIGPENISDQITVINKKVGDVNTWIDMETKVRSNQDKLFDMAKVENCLLLSSYFVK